MALQLASAFNFRKYWIWTTRNYGEHFSIWKEIMLLDTTKWPRSDVDTSWWKRDKIFWWDKRNWWLQFSKVEVVLPVISPADWFAVAFFIGLRITAIFLAGALLKNRKRGVESTFRFTWIFICLAKTPKFVQCFPQRV